MHTHTWYHLGINSVARSTLAVANTKHSYAVFEKLFYALLQEFQFLTEARNFEFTNPLYAFDSTSIALCLSVFPWAKFRSTKGAVKPHTLLNNRTVIPEFINITDGKVSDATGIKQIDLPMENGSIITFDRAYVDFELWERIIKKECFFVTRNKTSQNLYVIQSHKINPGAGVLADETVGCGDFNAQNKFPYQLRRVTYHARIHDVRYEFITNNFELSAELIAFIYKQRRQVELFFKWIKQNLKIKTFLGISKNAFMTQIWVAMIYYLVVAYIRFQTRYPGSLLSLTRMIKETLMCRRDLIDILSFDEQTVVRLKGTAPAEQQMLW